MTPSIFRSMLSAHAQRPAAATPVRLTIPKWPFVLADATLLVVALGLWSAGGANRALPELFCLASVALGAVLIATPFALEAFPPGSWRMLAGISGGDDAAPGAEGEWRRQANVAAEADEHAARANAALENSARRFDARFAPLVEIQQSLATAVTELREVTAARAATAAGEAQATTREFERLRREQAEKFKTTEAKITALEDTLGLIAAHIRTLAAPPAPVASAPSPIKTRVRDSAPVEDRAPAPVEERVLVAAGDVAAESGETAYLGSVTAFAPMPADPALPVEEPPAEKMPEEQSLMARALSRAQSSGETPAVAGIIMARARRPRKSKPPMPPASAAAPAAMGATAEVAEAAAVENPAEAAGAVPEELAEGETNSALRRSARAKALALRGAEEQEAKQNTPVVFTPPRTEEATDTDHSPTQGELLAREADTIRRKRASRNPLSASALTAHVLIGIGNKPFVRGSGPGLTQDKGVPMEFVEIGQWRWVAPAVVKEPITVRIFKNDEIAATGEDIVLKPGQSLEVSPVFPG
jgi:hypothetical protein